MADQDYPHLYEEMEDSAQRTRTAAIAFEHVLGGPEADMVPVNGYPAQPTIAGRVKTRLDPIIDEIQDRVDGVIDTVEAAAESVKRFAGTHASAPSTRYDGSPLQPGDEYQNTVDGLRYNWSGNAWVALNSSAQALEAKLANPAQGAEVVGATGLMGTENTASALARHERMGQQSGIAKCQGQNPGAARLFLAGYDSLTAGAGGSSWHQYFRKIMRGQLGYGGPGLQLFSGEIASSESASFGVNGLSAILENGPYFTYSIGGYGVYALAANGSATLDWKPKSAWATARVFYLKQPGGGTFLIGTNDTVDAAKVLVDTASAEVALGYVDVAIGKGTAGQTLGARKGTGLICLFGALFVNSATGFLFGNIAKGGRKLSDVAAQDSAIRRQWFAVLAPSHFILNGGANDKDTRTGPQHKADLTAIISDMQAASPTTSISIVQHNSISGESTTYLPAHAVQKIAVAKELGTNLYDNRRLLGTYAEANAAGLMFDGVHPNDKANRPIASYNAECLGFSGNSADPGETPYGGGGAAPVIERSGSLSTKYLFVATLEKTTVYTLGLVAGRPVATLRLTVTCNRDGSRLSRTKLLLMTINNSTTTNAAIGTTVPSVVYSVNDTDAGANAGDFTVESEIVSGKCVISVTPANYPSSFVVECDYALPYNTVTGQAIFEN